MRGKYSNQRNRKKLPLITGLAVMLAFLVLCLAACQAGGKKGAAVVTTEPTVQTEGAMAAVETTEKIEAVESSAPEETAAVALVADVPEAAEPVTEPATEPEEVGMKGTVANTNVLNVRANAGIGNTAIGSLNRGDSVTAYQKASVAGVYWLKIDNGWVSSQYISLSGDIKDVPTVEVTTTTTNNPVKVVNTGNDKNTDDTDNKEDNSHNHSYVKKVTKATCTTQGYTTYTCSCGDTYKSDYVPATGHTYGDWVTTKEPTTTSTGTAKRTCKVCGKSETKVLSKVVENHTHSYTSKVTKEATCGETGIRTYTCSCGDTYTEAIPKRTVHGFGDWVTIKEPTTTSTGLASRTCTGCGISETKTLPKLEGTTPSTHTHSWGAWKEVAAGCTYDGYKYRTCSTCGAEETAAGASALGHSYVVTSETAATCTVNGSRVYTCSRCGDSYTETLTASHQWEHHDAVTHTESHIVCSCGWSGPTVDAWVDHMFSLGVDYDANQHSYHSEGWIVTDVEAYDVCTVCGTKK